HVLQPASPEHRPRDRSRSTDLYPLRASERHLPAEAAGTPSMTRGAEGAGRTRGDRTPAANTGSDHVRGSMSVQCCRICGEPAPEELEKVERHDGLNR